MRPHLVFSDRTVGTLGALQRSQQVLLVDLPDMPLKHMFVSKRVGAIRTNKLPGSRIVQNGSKIHFAITMLDDRLSTGFGLFHGHLETNFASTKQVVIVHFTQSVVS